MQPCFLVLPGSVTAPKGFSAAGVFCDIKKIGTGKGSEKGQKPDLALIVSDAPAAFAGMYTTNQVCAAPVKVCQARRGRVRVIVANSGNANACTGKQGEKDARAMCQMAAERLALSSEEILVASTGRIGVALPMENIRVGIEQASDQLGFTADHGHQAAVAIMTSDTRPKELALEIPLSKGIKIRLGGICKGAGMIQPGMSPTGRRPATPALHATMLSFLTTDAAVEPSLLKKVLGAAVAQSFNRITVDGDMSTNDTVLLLANGQAGNPPITASSGTALVLFQKALNFLTLELAKMIVRDGEGVSRFVTVRVSGARNFLEADAAARAVANSTLVKTSWCGGDPNWGRILDALGYSAAKIVEQKVDVAYSAPGSVKLVYALRRGQPTPTPFEELQRVVAGKEFDLHIHLGLGRGSASIYTCDLTEAYVDFNKGAVGDPAALGG